MTRTVFVLNNVRTSKSVETLHEDMSQTLEIVISLQNKGMIALAPYVNSLLYANFDSLNSSPNPMRGIQDTNKMYIVSGFCSELWVYGNTISKDMLELIHLADSEGIRIKAKTHEVKLLLAKKKIFASA